MGYTQLSQKTPFARKEHTCIWCGQNILKGEKYTYSAGIWEGDFQTQHWHMECMEAFVYQLNESHHHNSYESDEMAYGVGDDGEFEPYTNRRPKPYQPDMFCKSGIDLRDRKFKRTFLGERNSGLYVCEWDCHKKGDSIAKLVFAVELEPGRHGIGESGLILARYGERLSGTTAWATGLLKEHQGIDIRVPKWLSTFMTATVNRLKIQGGVA